MREVGLRTVARAKSLWQEGGVVPGRLCGQRVGVQCRRREDGYSNQSWGAL